MTQEQALTPRAERLVNFHGDQITVALVGEDEPYVPLRTLAEYLGLEWSSQYRRVQRDSVLARSIRTLTVHRADGKLRDMLCLPLDKLAGWLFGLTVSKVRADLAPRLELYREECFKVLWREFQSDVVQRQPHAPASVVAPTLPSACSWNLLCNATCCPMAQSAGWRAPNIAQYLS